jgi:hypothetical protein
MPRESLPAGPIMCNVVRRWSASIDRLRPGARALQPMKMPVFKWQKPNRVCDFRAGCQGNSLAMEGQGVRRARRCNGFLQGTHSRASYCSCASTLTGGRSHCDEVRSKPRGRLNRIARQRSRKHYPNAARADFVDERAQFRRGPMVKKRTRRLAPCIHEQGRAAGLNRGVQHGDWFGRIRSLPIGVNHGDRSAGRRPPVAKYMLDGVPPRADPIRMIAATGQPELE